MYDQNGNARDAMTVLQMMQGDKTHHFNSLQVFT